MEDKIKKINKTILLISFSFLFFILPAFSQTAKIDSLHQAIKNAKEDTAKVSALIKLCDEFRKEGDASKAKDNCDKALELSVKISYLKGQGNAFAYLGIVHYTQGEYEKALENQIKSLEISEVIGDKQGSAMSYNSMGNVYNKQGNYNKALENYMKAQNFLEAIGDKQSVAYSHNNIGAVYYNQGNYDKAIENFISSLKIKEEMGDKKGTASSYSNIGAIYFQQGNYGRALENHLASLKIREEISDRKGIAESNNLIGLVYLEQGNFDKALISFLKALSIQEEIKNKAGIVSAFNNIGNVYSRKSEKPEGKSPEKIKSLYDKALENYFSALKISEEIGDKSSLASSYNNIAAIYTSQKKFSEAEEMLNKSLSVNKEIGNKDGIKFNFSALSELYEAQNNYKNAFEFHKKYSAIKDSLLNEQSNTQIAKMQTIYETDKKQKEIELLNKDKEIQTTENKKQKVAIYSIVGGLALVLVLVFFIFRSNRQKQKANLMLERKNIAISQQKEEIEKINLELEKLSIVASETDNSVFIMDADANIEWANAGFTRLLGYTLEEYINKNGKNLLSASGNHEIKSIFQTVFDSKKSVVYDAINETKSGNKIWMQTTLTPILSENGTITKIVAIDSNVTEIKNAEIEIKHKNKEITDSINYAKRIQEAILPSEEYLKKCFDEFCVLFKPKDIVSGDFYWTYKTPDNKIIWAAIDCTGHGVPGAFMSMVGNSLLNEIVVENKIEQCDEILNQLRKSVIKALRQSGEAGTQKDGMDIALCILDKNTNMLQFSGANNPLWLLRNNECIIMKPDKMPIGYFSDLMQPFTKQEIQLMKKDTIYTFTDGFEDQFGGPNQKKFMAKQFRELLLSIQYKSMPEQKEILSKTLNGWMNGVEQIDDICVVGVRV